MDFDYSDQGTLTANTLREVFDSIKGRWALTYILQMLGYFDMAETNEQVERQNIAKQLLAAMHIGHPEDHLAVIGHLIDMPVYDPDRRIIN